MGIVNQNKAHLHVWVYGDDSSVEKNIKTKQRYLPFIRLISIKSVAYSVPSLSCDENGYCILPIKDDVCVDLLPSILVKLDYNHSDKIKGGEEILGNPFM